MQAKDMTETLKSVSSRMIARYDMAIDAIVSNKTIPQADY